MPELTLYGKWDGTECWVKWKDGEITSDHAELLESIELYLKRFPDDSIRTPQMGVYDLKEIRSDLATFYHYMRRRFLDRIDRVEGDIPKPKPAPDWILH